MAGSQVLASTCKWWFVWLSTVIDHQISLRRQWHLSLNKKLSLKSKEKECLGEELMTNNWRDLKGGNTLYLLCTCSPGTKIHKDVWAMYTLSQNWRFEEPGQGWEKCCGSADFRISPPTESPLIVVNMWLLLWDIWICSLSLGQKCVVMNPRRG